MPVTTTYIHDSDDDCDGVGDIIEERVGGAVSQIYCREGNIRVLGGYPTVTIRFTAGGGAFYYHHDDLGNVVALTDAAGNPVERYRYDDYGQVTFLSADGTPLVGSDGMPVRESSVGNRFLFQGMEMDSETGLYSDTRWNSDPYAEYCVRTYDPNTGRYTTRARGVIRSNNGNSTRRGVIRTSNGSTSRKAGGNVRDAIGALRSVGHNPSSFANDNPWTPSRLTGRPVGQPSAAGLGAHVQRFGNLGGTVGGLDGKLGGLDCNFGAYGGGRTFAYWPHMHKHGTHKLTTLQTTRGFLTRGISFPH
jgi:YD repeat-containing protein